MTMKPIQVGLLGIGTVGSGVFNVLQRNQDEISRRAGRGIEIAMVADLDVERAKSVVGSKVQVVNDARAVIANPDHFRIVFLPHEADLREAINRLALFLDKYRKRHGTDKPKAMTADKTVKSVKADKAA